MYFYRFAQRCSIIMLCVLLSTVYSMSFAATNRLVPGSYTTIQAAINAAVDGDVVIVSTGTYVENIDFLSKNITVRSTNPTNSTVVAATIIDANASGNGVKIASDAGICGGLLDGFTIKNGSRSGIFIYNSTATISNCVIKNNNSYSGGGIFIRYGGPTISNCTISDNTATTEIDSYGGGIYIDQCSAVISNCTITNNTSHGGGGIYINSCSPSITNCTVTGNTSNGDNGYAGGIYIYNVYADALPISNCNISNNIAKNGGGISCVFTSALITISNCIFNHNTASQDGGGMYMYSSTSAIINNCVVSANTAMGNGGGMYCYDFESTIRNCTFNGNAADNGGGIFTSGYAAPGIFNSIIASSTAGGGITVQTGTSVPVVKYCDVFNNTGGNYVGMTNPTNKDGNISADPFFADAANQDFHLKSKGGRWNGSAWVTDSVHSPCIDAGDPASAYDQEPAPNGSRINMGAYGNTAKASKWFSMPYCADAMVYDAPTTIYLGDDIYNTTAQWQTIDGDTYAGRKATFYVRGQNDGSTADKLCFKGPKGDNRWAIKYIDSATGNDITSSVTGAGWMTATTVAVKSIQSIKIEVIPVVTVTPGEVYPINVTVSSVADTSKKDIVQILATMKITCLPDALINQASSGIYIGNDIYNSTGAGQAETKEVYAGVKTAFYIRGQNDSNYADHLLFKAPAGSANWNIKYVDSSTGNDITASVTSTGWQTATTVPVGSNRSIKVEVTPAATVTPGKKLDLAVSVYMAGDMSRRDVVLCTTQTILVYQPDGMAYQASSGSYIGGCLYNTTGSGQTETRSISRGTKTTYYFRMKNNGNVAETFNLRAPAGNANWIIKYIDSGTGVDVTANMISGAGWTSGSIPRSGSRSMKVEVTALSSLGVGVELPVLVTIKSNNEPAKVDAVKFITTTK